MAVENSSAVIAVSTTAVSLNRNLGDAGGAGQGLRIRVLTGGPVYLGGSGVVAATTTAENSGWALAVGDPIFDLQGLSATYARCANGVSATVGVFRTNTSS
jgi:hypothetical protein